MPVHGTVALLPRELVDIIVKNVEDDARTLKACRLISKSWTLWQIACATHLFRRLDIYIGRRGKSIDCFIKFANSAPLFTVYIRSLTFRGSAINRTAKRAVDADMVYRLLRVLPNLRLLRLDCLQFGRTCGWPVHASTFCLEKLIMNCYIVTRKGYCTFLEILALFSELGELHIQPYSSRCTSLPSTMVLPSTPPTVRSLILERAQYPMVALARDSLRIPASSTQSLSVACTSVASLRNLGEMILEYGPHLTRLEIDIMELLTPISEDQWIEHHSDGLRTLESLSIIVHPPQPNENAWTTMVNFLAIVPSSSIRDVTIICALRWNPKPVWKWASVSAMLERFPQLRKVSLFWSDVFTHFAGSPADVSNAKLPHPRLRRKWGQADQDYILDAIPPSKMKDLVQFDYDAADLD